MVVISRPVRGVIGIVLITGSIVLLFFVILSGVTASAPLNSTFFLQADTSGITGARPITQWTYFYMCGAGNTDCGPAWPDPPLGWAWNTNPQNAPGELVGDLGGGTTSSYYFYMWRFGWVFYLITLFFDVLAFFAGFLACCGRLGSAVSGLMAAVALFFYTFAVALMTATFVKARNVFLASGRSAAIGTYAFGFSWGAWGALLLATIIFFAGARGDDYQHRRHNRRSRSTRSRKSYEVSGSRRVKDDYA